MPQPSISSVKTNNYKNSKKKIFGKNNKKNLNQKEIYQKKNIKK